VVGKSFHNMPQVSDAGKCRDPKLLRYNTAVCSARRPNALTDTSTRAAAVMLTCCAKMQRYQSCRTLFTLLILSAGVKLGVKGSVHLGAVRLLRPDCSWSTHSSAACSNKAAGTEHGRYQVCRVASSHKSLCTQGDVGTHFSAAYNS
jgi:hypothetical protein